MQAYFENEGLNIKDADMLYDMILASLTTDEVPIEYLIDGMLRVRGPATSIDLVSLTFETRMLAERHHTFEDTVTRQLSGLFSKLDDIVTLWEVHEQPVQNKCGASIQIGSDPIRHH